MSYFPFIELPPGIFHGLRNLKSVDLSSNKLMHIAVEVFEDLLSLEKLDLSSNLLKNLSFLHEKTRIKTVNMRVRLRLNWMSTYNPLQAICKFLLLDLKLIFRLQGKFHEREVG